MILTFQCGSDGHSPSVPGVRVLCKGVVRGSCAGSGGLVRGLVRGLGCCRHRIWHRIAKSLHLYSSEMFFGGAGHQNHCKINAFVWFGKVDWGAGHSKSLQILCICIVWEVGWGGGARESFQKQCIFMVLEGWWGGAPESLQTQCMCMVLEGWLGERRTRLIAKSMHLQGFGRLIGGAENHCKINIFV